MSARLNIQIIQQQPLNTLLLSSHRAATVLLRQLSAGDLFLAAKWFRSCCNSSNALCATPAAALNSNGRPAVHCAPLCTGGGGTAAVCSGGKFTQDWDLWAALGQLAQQGGGPIALFLHPNPAALLHLHARVACFTCITWTVRLPWHPFLFRT